MNTYLYNATIITGYKSLTDEDLKSLRDQDVCLDDWDYMIFVENCNYTETTDLEDRPTIVPEDTELERLLVGCCDNKWYMLTFRGKDGMLGVAYHA